MDRTLLLQYGIDYDKGLINCMGDEAFFQTLLSMFLEDSCFSRGKDAYASKDYKEMFSCMHELKGASGKAALIELYKAVVPLVELLRVGDIQEDEVSRLYGEAEKAYQRTCDGIKLAIGA